MPLKFVAVETGEKREGESGECMSGGGKDGSVLCEIPVRCVTQECIEPFEIGRFVGREREMETLRRGMTSAVAGDGRLILIAGERGIGKTRLADEAGRFAASEGAQVLWGRCWEGEGTPPFWPFIQILRGYLKGWTTADALRGMGAAAAVIGRLLPELRESQSGLCGETVGGELGGAGLDRDEHRFRLFDGLARLFKSGAEYQPLTLIVEDLHWADQPSLVLLEFLAGEVRDARILLIATYRDDALDPGHPLLSVLAELVRHPWSERLALQGLTKGEVARFMARYPRDERPDAMVRAVHEKTEGNPFFVRELVRLLAAEGRLGDAKPGRRGLSIPETVREVMAHRLGRLSPDCNSLLEIAAVIGREFDLDVLRSASDLTAMQILGVLEEAQRARVVSEVPDVLGRFRFTHVLIRETIYDGLLMSRRISLHHRIGTALEEGSRVDPEPLQAVLAYHLLQAAPVGGDCKALHYAVRAGKRAAEQLAYEDANVYFERALEMLSLTDPCDVDLYCELLLLLGDAQGRAGAVVQARGSFLEAVRIARKLGAQDQVARAAIGLAGLLPAAKPPDRELISLLEDALNGLPERDSALRVRGLDALARALYFAPTTKRAMAAGEEAVEIAKRLNDPALLGVALDARLHTLWKPRNIQKYRAMAEKIVKLGAESGDRDVEAQGRFFCYVAALQMGEVPELDVELDVCMKLTEELRHPRLVWQVTLARSGRALMRGDIQTSEMLAGRARQLGERIHATTAHQYFLMQLFGRHIERGVFDGVQETIMRFAAQDVQVTAWRAALAFMHSVVGQPSRARQILDELGAEEFRDLPEDAFLLVCLSLVGEACAIVEDAGHAEVVYRVLIPYWDQNVVVGAAAACLGSVSHYLGMLAHTLGRWDDAVRHFEDALAMNTRLQAPPLIARTQHEFAKTLLSRDAAGDEARAAELLRAAIATYERLQMEGYLPKARELEGRLRERIGAEGVGVAEAVVCDSAADLQRRPDVAEQSLVRMAAQSPTGQRQPAARAGQIAASRPKGLFRREGEYWSLGYQGSLVRLRDTRGLQYLGYLLRRPGQEVHAFDLATLVSTSGLCSSPQLGGRSLQEEHLRYLRCANAGPMSDMKARFAYQRRLGELRDLIEEAKELNDYIKAGQLRNEMEVLIAEVSAAFGHDGSPRIAGSSAERARINVRNSIAAALKTIRRHDEVLGRHLWNAVRTGTFCSYVPETPVSWTF